MTGYIVTDSMILVDDEVCCDIINTARNLRVEDGPSFRRMASRALSTCNRKAPHYEEAKRIVDALNKGEYNILPY